MTKQELADGLKAQGCNELSEIIQNYDEGELNKLVCECKALPPNQLLQALALIVEHGQGVVC